MLPTPLVLILALMYLTSAWLRVVASKVNKGIRLTYLMSVPIWMVYAGGYFWLAIYGQSLARTIFLQWWSVPFIIVVGILPPIVGIRQGSEYKPRKRKRESDDANKSS